jgi:crotonobetainyl-CoA:carnitine CoA-transferase CaiB-like acyl-CoA transferase
VNKHSTERTGAAASPQAAGRRGPLAGIKVVDLTHMLAGPYCTWLLGALGADVIKVEMPGRGDFTRSIAPFANERSVYFSSVNRNKRSITLNLKQPLGKEALLRLVRNADVFVENNRPGVMRRLDLDYESLAKINPRLVYAAISGFGQTGPYSERPAFDAVVQAMSGIMSITGDENGPPARVGASIGDIGASLFGTIGVLAALSDRNTTGRGAQVDIAMFDSQIAILENAVARYLNAGDVPRRLGSRHPLIAPFQAFPTKDEPVAICVDTEEQWSRFCKAIERTDLMSNPHFGNGSDRAKYHAELEPELIKALMTRTRAEWLSILDAADVPCGPINDVPAVVKDPQIVARGMIAREGDGGYVNQPIHFSSYPQMPHEPAPDLGDDTNAILAEHGFSSEEIAKMRGQGAI